MTRQVAAPWPGAFEAVRERLARILASVPVAGAQLCVSRGGTPLLNAALGEARTGTPMATDSVVYWSCAGKPLLATALATLVDEGGIRFADPVARHLPEFAANGKEAVTVADVLSHAGGFRHFEGPGPDRSDYADFVRRVLALPLEPGWVPGGHQGYHQETGWYVLAALLESALGQHYGTVVAERVCRPLALRSTWATVPPPVHDGIRDRLAVPSFAGRQGLRRYPYLVSRAGARAKVPPYGFYGTMSDLASFYEAALSGLRGPGPFPVSPPVLRAMAAPPRGRVPDRTWDYPCAMGLGYFCGLSDHNGFGGRWSDSSFGASGRIGQVFGGADPETGVVIAASFGALAFDNGTKEALMDALYAAALA
ncbi:serine hydrolase domain-containing protein [Kitasatospora cineracea]|uniref:serine hydrolase domain-containing protein n=1 Tax=Kitasatospora cineracea TaxID=88074 RepID=UPI00378C8AB3